MDTPPSSDEIAAYSDNLCHVFNAFALDDEDFVLVPDRYRRLPGDLLVARFRLIERRYAPEPDNRPAVAFEHDDEPFSALGGSDLPYLKPAKNLRIYVDSSVFVLKPAHYRHFSPAAGQSDGDNIIADLMGSDTFNHSTKDGA